MVELANFKRAYQETEDFVLNIEHELDTLMTPGDWLQVYSKAIKDQRLDMDVLID